MQQLPTTAPLTELELDEALDLFVDELDATHVEALPDALSAAMTVSCACGGCMTCWK